MLRKLFLACSVVILTILICKTGFAVTFNAKDFIGTWDFHELISGDGPDQEPGWVYGTVTVDSGGNGTYSATNHNGQTSSGTMAMPWNISNIGIITSSENPEAPWSDDLHGVMSDDKKLMVLTQSEQPKNQPKLSVFLKRGSTNNFNAKDFIGTWDFHELISGDGPDQEPGWVYGTVTVDSGGNGTYSATNHNGQTSSGTMAMPWNISNIGIITSSENPEAPWSDDLHGVMSDDKKLMVLTQSEQPKNQPKLSVFLKRGSTNNFSAKDFKGTWYFHYLISGDGPTQEPGWGYGKVIVYSGGNGTFSATNHNGQTSSGTMAMPWNISNIGIITSSENPEAPWSDDLHGVMSDDKKLMVLTQSEQPKNQPQMYIFINRSSNVLPFIPLLLGD